MKLLVLALMGCALLGSLDASFPKLNGKNAFLELFMGKYRSPTPPPRKSSRFVTEGSIRQNLDHFDADNIETFQQRFLSNYEHFDVNGGGPMFVLVGGEWPVFDDWLLGGHFYDLADEHDAAMFYVEHRFYGTSFPEGRDADLDTLQYLNAEQAMYDTAYFIEQIRYMLPHFANSEVILVGPSIAGSLVTWYQRVYSDEIAGAWASSAPLLASTNFFEAKEVSGAVLRNMGGQVCYDRVESAFNELAELYEAENYDEIRRVLNVCPNTRIETQRGRWTLFEILTDEFLFMAVLSAPEIYFMGCDIITRAPTGLEGLGEATSVLFDGQCIDFDYEAIVEFLSEEQWLNEFNLEIRLAAYQMCSEFGWYPSSTSSHHPFGNNVPLELFHAICEEVFDLTPEEMAENVAATNTRFGGLNPEVENLITTQGMNDPFRPIGLQDVHNETVTAHVIHGAGHIADFFSYSGYDTEEVRFAKRLVADHIRRFLNDAKK